MLRTQVIGCGAAGNKATITLIESGKVSKDNMSYILVNSTDKDIPPAYRSNSMIFGNTSVGGCGKERTLGKKMILEDPVNGVRGLDDRIDRDADFIIVCGSTEGGSGSASIPIISKYIQQVLHKPVIAVLFFGFGDDVRGMQNSIEICQELSNDIGVISICNSLFLDAANGNKIKAEKLANDQFSTIVRILMGIDIHESLQNIDDTDLKKVIFTPGYMSIESIVLKDIKNIDQYNKHILNALDNEVYSMESPHKSAKRIAVIFTVKENADYVDYSCEVFKSRYGIPYELFTHVQDSYDASQNVTVIAVGQKMPIDAVKEIFENYKKASLSVDKDKDDFFSSIGELQGNPEDGMFNMFSNSEVSSTSSSKASFFEEYGIEIDPKKKVEKKQSSPTVKTVGEY